jgi:hypothetical protein
MLVKRIGTPEDKNRKPGMKLEELKKLQLQLQVLQLTTMQVLQLTTMQVLQLTIVEPLTLQLTTMQVVMFLQTNKQL